MKEDVRTYIRTKEQRRLCYAKTYPQMGTHY